MLGKREVMSGEVRERVRNKAGRCVRERKIRRKV